MEKTTGIYKVKIMANLKGENKYKLEDVKFLCKEKTEKHEEKINTNC